MRRSAAFLAAGAGAVLVGLALPAVGQEPPVAPAPSAPAQPPVDDSAPRSILPQGFGPDSAPVVQYAPPIPRPAQDLSATPGTPATPGAPGTDPAAAGAPIDPFDLPAATGAAIDLSGPLTPAMGGYGPGLFAGSDGRFVAGLLKRLRAPVASRWAHIVLRRTLLTQSGVPANIAPADWIAWRGAVLIRMGEADGAVALVDGVPVDRFSPLLYKVAGQAHLAAADLPGLCPLAANAVAVSGDVLWRLAAGMCGGLTGDDLTSASTFDKLRADDSVDPFDVQLAERVGTVSGGAGRAANIDWDEAPRLTPYRFGVAVAAGVVVPPVRLAALGPSAQGWVLRAPSASAAARAAALGPAAALGIASAREMVSAIAAAAVGLDGDALAASPAAPLRIAFAATATASRVAALRDIRQARGSNDPLARYAALVETALPAARVAPAAAFADDAPEIVAALLSAGLEAEARRWWPVADRAGGAARARVWALLAPGGSVPVTTSDFKAWREIDKDDHRARLLLAALTGLGRANGSDWEDRRSRLGLAAPVPNSWMRAIDDAAAAGRGGDVAVLAATALQCDWTAVPATHFQHIVAAYARTGRAHEARLIAAEAVTRG